MNCNNNLKHKGHSPSRGGGRGPTSFWMQDPRLVFRDLNLQPGDSFLDLGCGMGDYSFEALRYLGCSGKIYALDSNSTAIAALEKEISIRRIENIVPVVADVLNPLKYEDELIDVCFISTALHAMDLSSFGESLFSEIKRVLRQSGKLSIIECHKRESDFGPPLGSRISTEELEAYLNPLGFKRMSLSDLGYNYLIQFNLEEGYIL